MPLPGRSEVASFLLTVSLGQYRTVIERQKCDAGRMASPVRPVIVKRVLETMNAMEAHSFYKEVLPVLSADRPQIVFDMSKTHTWIRPASASFCNVSARLRKVMGTLSSPAHC